MLRTRIRAGTVAGLLLSLAFAVALTALAVSDRYVDAWAPAFGQRTRVTLRVPHGPRVVRDAATGRAELDYEHRRTLVPRGVTLAERDSAHFSAFVYETLHRPPRTGRIVGVFAIHFTLAMALTSYLRRFAQNRLRLLRTQTGVLLAMALLALVAKALLLFTALPELWVPLAAVPLWVAASFDRRTGFVVTVVLAFAMASLLEFDMVFLAVTTASGMGATLLLFDRKRTRQLVAAGALGGTCAAALFLAIMVTFGGSYDIGADLLAFPDSSIIGCLGGGVSAGLLAALLRMPAERLLGHVSREKLLELVDLEQPLLQKLAREAPGTYEHSRAMANLAEQAASAIGADALLTRVGAYYHDLGKTAQAEYFVENLGPDQTSPHDLLDPDVSADAIIAHVVIGTRILRSGGIPEAVVEFAYTHHGTQVVEFFWNKCLQQGNPKNLDASYFRYPGMKPQTKETAILMLVDSIEAASRTIDVPTREHFQTMIQRVIFTKLAQGQLDDCGLGMSDLRVVTTRMVDTLVNMHHHRIKYQWQAKRAEEFGVPSRVVRDSAPDIELGPPASLPPSLRAGPSVPPPTTRSPSVAAAESHDAPREASATRVQRKD